MSTNEELENNEARAFEYNQDYSRSAAVITGYIPPTKWIISGWHLREVLREMRNRHEALERRVEELERFAYKDLR